MIKSGQAYRAAITGDARRILLLAVIDIISPDIVFGVGETSGQILWSKLEQLHDKVFGNPTKYATLERDRWALDGTWDLLPDDPAQTVGQMGYIGNVLSGADGTFSTPPWVELQFSGVSVLQACSVYFPDNDYDGLPEDFTVELYRKVAELLYEQHAQGELNPAQIMNYFTEEEEHHAVAALFNTRIKELTTAGEQEKAIKETILRVKEYSIETATRNLDPTDIQGLQRLMNAKKAVQDLHKLHISIN